MKVCWLSVLGLSGTGTSETSIADDAQIESTSVTDEEVLRQYRVPLALLSSATLRATLAGEGLRGRCGRCGCDGPDHPRDGGR